MVLANNLQHLHFAISKPRDNTPFNAGRKRRNAKIMPKPMRNIFGVDGAAASNGR